MDIPYFSYRKKHVPEEFHVAIAAVQLSQVSSGDKAEIERRISNIVGIQDKYQQTKQSVDFLCELAAYYDLQQRQFNPHWVPESNTSGETRPDIEYIDGNEAIFVEVKHINLEEGESKALRTPGQFYEIDTDHNYHVGLGKQVQDKFNEAKKKFSDYSKFKKRPTKQSQPDILYLFLSPALSARILGDVNVRMAKLIRQYADKSVEVRYFNLWEYFKTDESRKRSRELNEQLYKLICETW